jgi:uncharacterized protein (UPF0333 family)
MGMIKMDQRAQISIEYILLVAVILLIVIVFALVITDQSEQNSVATAAQLGASNATANLVFTNNSQTPVQVTSVNMTNSTSPNTNITLTIHFSRSVASQQATIFTSITNSLQSAGFTNITQGSNYLLLTTSVGTGIRHTYNITLS